MKGSTLVITWLEVWDGYWYEYLGRSGILGILIEKLAANLSGTMIAISENTRRGLLSIGASGDIKVATSGIDFEEIDAVKPAGDKSDVIFVGRLIKDKNVDMFIRTTGLVKQVYPDVRCHIIGDGPERGRLEGLVAALGLEPNVSFLGNIDSSQEVFSYMKASSVFVFASTREGLGIVLLEANACGLPVVTVRHPQNASAELIIGGKNGFLCEPDEEDMAKKIMLALERTQDMSSDCLAYAGQYTWESIVAIIEDAYSSALRQGRAK